MITPRQIPSIDALLQRPALTGAIASSGRAAVARALRAAADALRTDLEAGADGAAGAPPQDPDAAGAWIERRALASLETHTTSLRRVINATGVLLHTNLGRAPIADAARHRAADLAGGYSNLEYDLDAGARGSRHVHVEALLTDLTGAEAAVVVNNNAAATLLVLSALAAGREVVASRGELVEIGGGFRVPDVMAQSGAMLREVGTTNRTRVSDYAAAIGDRTALLLRVHPSNFSIDGFTERPPLDALVALSRRLSVPLFEDLGSGWLGVDDDAPQAVANEPAVRASIAAGVDVVAFSGDKLLGGPQAGIILGRRALVEPIRRHPLMRALRVDKMTYAALAGTLDLWRRAPARREIPIYRMLTLTADDIGARATSLTVALRSIAELDARVIDGASTTGGGSAPESAIPTKLVSLRHATVSAAALEARLRRGATPVIARIHDDALLIDLRTVDPSDDAAVAAAVRGALDATT